MKPLRLAFAVATLVLPGPGSGAERTYTPGEPVRGTFDGLIQPFLDQHCLECHDDSVAKAGLNLLDLGPVDETNAAVWKSVWAQVSLREMPPGKRPRPEVIDRLQFTDWVVDALQEAMKDKGGFQAHLDPKKANFLEHDLLFRDPPAGIHLKPTSSPARLWRVTPQEHITRLNELINVEPPYNPAKPGLRTHGDAVPTNHGGELKLYFGTDNILRWEGGTVAYATAVKSVPAVLSLTRKHGLKNYPGLYSVNSAEATQILGKAEDILQYMASGPLSLVGMPEQITDDPRTYDKVKPPGDLRGLPTAIVYSTKFLRPATPLLDLMKDDALPSDEALRATVDHLFEALAFRPPSAEEADEYIQLVRESIAKIGKTEGVFLGLSAIFLDRDALFRPELAETGEPDAHGRVMLQDWELGLAVNHALRYLKPDPALRAAILGGKMRTREDVEREVTRMLRDDTIRKPRILQFFRDYFDHDLAGTICKDNRALAATGITARGDDHYLAMFDAAASTDRLIEIILKNDREVLKELLTTRQVVATETDRIYFGRKRTAQETKVAAAEHAKAEAATTAEEEAALSKIRAELASLQIRSQETPGEPATAKSLDRRAKELDAEMKRILQQRKRRQQNAALEVAPASLSGPPTEARVSRPSFGSGSMKPERILATAPEGERLGILTHPAWLVSHSDAMDNHAIRRGIWIRERLLGGGIPDVPITVDAKLPDEPQNTLRERMRVTRENYCWSCHEKMDPLGLPFEIYNHAGLYRTTELDKPVDGRGEIKDSGDPALDGPVANAIEMIRKLAASERVEQVFVRHAFRFWMGRNETLNDAPVLQAAHRAYRDNGGSLNALITSLLTSDAFLYREVDRKGSTDLTALRSPERADH
jgi:tRNA A37 threonylcarbamoyladenosine modification protein TsaB